MQRKTFKKTFKHLELVCGCFSTFPLLFSTLLSDISEMHIKKNSFVDFFFKRKEENEFLVFTLNGMDSFICVLNISEVIIVK